MKKFLILALLIATSIAAPSAHSRAYVGFDLCAATNLSKIKEIAKKHDASEPYEIKGGIPTGYSIVMVDKYKIGDEFYSLSIGLYNGLAMEVGVRGASKLLEIALDKYEENYNRKIEKYNNGIYSTLHYYGIKNDAATEFVVHENRVGESGTQYYAFAYQCKVLHRDYEVALKREKSEDVAKKANSLGL